MLSRVVDIVLSQLSFFTIIPTGRADIVLALRYLDLTVLTVSPVLIGIVAGVGMCLLLVNAPLHLVSVICYVLLLVLTGFIHLDGFTDTVDALFAPREKRLEVLRDPRIGACGAAALVLILSLGLVAVISKSLTTTLVKLALSELASRTACSVVIRLAPPAHPGLGQLAYQEVRRVRYGYLVPIVATLTTASMISLSCVLAVCVGLALSTLIIYRVAKAVGGVSGDLLGFSIELTRHMVLVALACTLY